MCVTLVTFALLMVAALTPAGAAVIMARDSDGAVTIVGQIARGDDEAFVDAVTTPTKTVYLSSSGGDLVASLRIAQLVRAWGLETVVAEYAQCASGCAVIWFAGKTRRIMAGGRIGLHSASTKEDSMTRSEVGNATLIAYLRSLGVPEAVLSLIEHTEPTSMHWINRVEAAEMGLYPRPPTPDTTEE